MKTIVKTIWRKEGEDRCGICRFWNEGDWTCHRHAPAVYPGATTTMQQWPTHIYAENWCGDFEPDRKDA